MKLLKSLIIIGVATPAFLSIFFIFQFGVNTIFLDEWQIVPLLKSYLTGHSWLPTLFSQYNENRPVFPHLVVLGLMHFTSYNIFYEMLVGWAFLSLTLFMLWRLLLLTFPEGKWVIIPIAWITYSFSQYETLLWGSASIAWYLTILMVVSTIYFLNKIKNSPILIIPAIICGFIASFSLIVGLLVWIVGLLCFRGISRKLLALYVISGITAFVLYFNGWTDPALNHAHTVADNPIEFLNFVLAFLGNATRVRAETIGIGAVPFSIYVGIAMVGIFIVVNLLYRHFHMTQNNQDAKPWLQIAMFGLLCGIMAAIGRLGIFGIDEALASRYVPLSNFFLDGTLVVTLMTLFHLKKITNTPRNRNIIKCSIVILMILVSFDIGLSNVVGWLGVPMFHERITVGNSCLMNFESASDNCLHKLYPDAKILRERAQFLQEFCLGPFASKCK
jgi:hypothetical protein